MRSLRFKPEAKLNITLEFIRGDHSISEICREYGIARNVTIIGERSLCGVPSSYWMVVIRKRVRMRRS